MPKPIRALLIATAVAASGCTSDAVESELATASASSAPAGPTVTIIGEAPDQKVRGDLYRLKQILETGEITTTKGQPAGAGRTGAISKFDDPNTSQEAPQAAAVH